MSQFKKLFDFYINSSIHVALAVVSLGLVTSLQWGLPVNWNLMFFIFFGTITGYNFVKYAGIAKLHHRSLAQGLRKIQILSFLSFLLLLIFAVLIPPEILIWCAFFALLTLLYALPVLNRGRNLRSISGIKIFIIALVWVGVTVILPFEAAGRYLNFHITIEVVQRFFLVLAWILPFEIRDLKHDLTQLGTIPQKVGVTKTKIIGVILVAAAVLLEFLQKNSLAEVGPVVLVGLISIGFIWKAGEKQSHYYSSFWVEAIPLSWLLILILFRML